MILYSYLAIGLSDFNAFENEHYFRTSPIQFIVEFNMPKKLFLRPCLFRKHYTATLGGVLTGKPLLLWPCCGIFLTY